MAVSVLPRYLSLSVSSGTTITPWFMEMVHEDGPSHGLFIAKGEKILSPFSKLELVDAGNGLAHIRCCYNNKYLAVRSETDHRISPVANERVEDQSAWSCTLFRVASTTQSSGVRVTVVHVHLGRRIVAREPDRILQVDRAGGAIFDFAVHDLSAIVNLPQFFSFKDSANDYGVTFVTIMNSRIRFLASGNSIDKVFEILPVDAGSFRILSLSNNKYWRLEGFYKPDVGDYSDVAVDMPLDFSTLFNIHRIDDNIVSFSLSHSDAPPLQRYENGLSLIPQIPLPNQARFVLEEAVRSRKIYNVRYNVLDAKILIGHPSSISSQSMDNVSSVSQNFSRTFTYLETVTTRWNATVSLKVGVSTTISVGIPLIADGSMTVAWEFSAAYEMGEEHTQSVTKEDKVEITVPPMTRIAVSRWESKGSYDVPYSYTQEDVLYDGQIIVSKRDDGLAVGINNCDIFYNVVETPLGIIRSGEEAAATREYRIIVPNHSRIVSTN